MVCIGVRRFIPSLLVRFAHSLRKGHSRLKSGKLPHPTRSRLLLAGLRPARMVRGTSFRAIAVRFVEGGAFAWTPALAGISGRRFILSVRVQRPAIQAHAYGCASAVPSLVTAEIPQSDVLVTAEIPQSDVFRGRQTTSGGQPEIGDFWRRRCSLRGSRSRISGTRSPRPRGCPGV